MPMRRRCSALWLLFACSCRAFTGFRVRRPSRSVRMSEMRAIDTHLHIWGDGAAPFPFSAAPPTQLLHASGVDSLLPLMDAAGVESALVVQPINYRFDHSFVEGVLRARPQRFKGMLLANPTLPPDEACAELRRLQSQGFGSVRFNPALWPEGALMTDPTGSALFKLAGELGMPVGVMCFKGLRLHAEDIEALVRESPGTKCVIDHFGFFLQGGSDDGASWAALLALARHPQVYVKTSAFFRVSTAQPPYEALRPRMADLMRGFGPQRLMWGSDFPYVLDAAGGYKASRDSVDSFGLSEEEASWVLRRTAESVFGEWGA